MESKNCGRERGEKKKKEKKKEKDEKKNRVVMDGRLIKRLDNTSFDLPLRNNSSCISAHLFDIQ